MTDNRVIRRLPGPKVIKLGTDGIYVIGEGKAHSYHIVSAHGNFNIQA